MPRTKAFANAGSAEINAMIERVAPAVLELLADGVPRRKPALVAALAGRHDADDVALALVRLTITERVVEAGGRYTLAAGETGGFYAKCDGCGGEVRAGRSGPPGAPGRPRAGFGSRGSGAGCR